MQGDFPQRFGPYELLRRVGVGGMAEVFLAKAPSIQGQPRLVAIKRMHPQLGNDRAAVEMLVQEAKLCLRFDHPAIAPTFELGHQDGIWYFVMEYVDGIDLGALAQIVDGLGERLDPVAVAFVVAAMARGLDHAHNLAAEDGTPLGIIHRDVSPHNVLIGQRGEVKLIDFGVAKVAARVEQTMAGVIKGKYAYMSPEQAAAEPLDARSDVFSLGICLWELLTSEPLFRLKNATSPFAVLHAVREGPIPSVAERVPSMPEALVLLTARCLDRDRQLRPQTAAEVADALEAWLAATAPQFGALELAGLVAGLLAAAPAGARSPADVATPALPHLDRAAFVPSAHTVVCQSPLALPPPPTPRPSPRPEWWPSRRATLQFLAVGSGALVFALTWTVVAWLVRSGRI